MARNLKLKTISLAVEIGVLCLLASGALAAPPLGRPQPLQPAQHLDLRLPSHAMEAGNSAEKSPNAFPSMAHRQNPGQEPPQLPNLGSDNMRDRPTVQDFVRRVHREGLPVARLFETKSALLHLGLNPRGKPGLWLVQKTR